VIDCEPAVVGRHNEILTASGVDEGSAKFTSTDGLPYLLYDLLAFISALRNLSKLAGSFVQVGLLFTLCFRA
jgi:hypothetical protein